MSKYYFLKVSEIVKETEDAVTIHFWHPFNEVVKYKPGQFLTLLIPVDGDKKERRSYSMCSSPYTDASLAVTVKKVSGGVISNYLNNRLAPGDILEVMEPMGTFAAEPHAANSRRVVLIGAGSGITPLISIAKSVLMVEPESEVVLLYGNRNESSIIFRQTLDDLKRKYATRLRVIHSLTNAENGWDGEKGRLTQAKILDLLRQLSTTTKNSEYYICGPDGLMDGARKALDDLNIPHENVHHESFATANTLKAEEPSTTPLAMEEEDDRLKTQEITIRYEGEEFKVTVEPHQTILEAALDMDIDLPYSCQAGMCTACMGRCLSGKVRLDEDDALTEAEIDEGFVLTCQAHPLTKNVVIEVE